MASAMMAMGVFHGLAASAGGGGAAALAAAFPAFLAGDCGRPGASFLAAGVAGAPERRWATGIVKGPLGWLGDGAWQRAGALAGGGRGCASRSGVNAAGCKCDRGPAEGWPCSPGQLLATSQAHPPQGTWFPLALIPPWGNGARTPAPLPIALHSNGSSAGGQRALLLAGALWAGPGPLQHCLHHHRHAGAPSRRKRSMQVACWGAASEPRRQARRHPTPARPPVARHPPSFPATQHTDRLLRQGRLCRSHGLSRQRPARPHRAHPVSAGRAGGLSRAVWLERPAVA